RGALVALIEVAQRALHRDDQERQRDERGRHDHAPRREGQQQAGRLVERVAHQAAPAEREQQRRSPHHRREHQGQGHDAADHRPPGEFRASQQPRERYAEDQGDAGRGQRGDQRQPQRVRHDVAGEENGQVPPGRPCQETREGRQEQREPQAGGEPEQGGKPRGRPSPSRRACVHGAMKPCLPRIACASSDSTNATNAAAASGFGAPASTAIGYSATTLCSSGISMPSTPPRLETTAVTYAMPASSSPSSTRVRRARTSRSFVSIAATTPARASACRANAPHGTSSAHRPSSSSPRPKSRSPPTPAGLPFGTAIRSRLRAKIRGSPATPPAAATWSMFEMFADAKTSTGAPSRICARSVELLPRFNTTSTPGLADSN